MVIREKKGVQKQRPQVRNLHTGREMNFPFIFPHHPLWMGRQTSRNSKNVVKRKVGLKEEGQTVIRDKKESWNSSSSSCLSFVFNINVSFKFSTKDKGFKNGVSLSLSPRHSSERDSILFPKYLESSPLSAILLCIIGSFSALSAPRFSNLQGKIGQLAQ